MSQIFDALLRSEVEHAGTYEGAHAESTKLLEHVERQVASRWVSGLLDPADLVADDKNFNESSIALHSADTKVSSSAHGDRVANTNLLTMSRVLPSQLSSESRFVCLTDKASPTAEAFRLLDVRLRNLRRVQPLKRLLITSTVPREGKSTVAANLACTLSQKSEEKVLLIEGDIRRPSLTQMFGLKGAPGISEVLQRTRSLMESICRIQETSLWILPAGSMYSAPLELLQSEMLPALLEQLNSWFDWIVIDSPPILPLADTSVWARMVDGILLITRQGVTEKQQLERGLQALGQSKLIGALLNCSKVPTYSSYYYRSSE